MIVFDDTLVAHYGGPGGAALSIAEPGGPFRVVIDFGRDPKTQVAPQRRLLLTAEHLFVLEPATGVLFADELRVRRFDREGHELDVVEGRGEEGRAQLALLASQDDAESPMRLICFGVDPKTGGPLRWTGEVGPQLRTRPWERRGSPAWLGDDLYLPVRDVGLFRFRGRSMEHFHLPTGSVQIVKGRLFAATRKADAGAIWADGERHVVCSGLLHPGGRGFAGAFLAPRPGGGYVVLRVDGGELPGFEGAPGRLAAGLYSALVFGPAGVFGIEESHGPRMVPAEL